jgi:hypothetical protein
MEEAPKECRLLHGTICKQISKPTSEKVVSSTREVVNFFFPFMLYRAVKRVETMIQESPVR